MSLSFARHDSKTAGEGSRASARRADPEQRRAAAATIRASKVARAKRLVQDSRYPSDEVLHSVAKLFARHWNL